MKAVLLPDRCTVFFALLLLGFILPAFGEENPDAYLSSVREQSGLQLETVRFKATYTYSHYIVDTFEEAERFDTSHGVLFERAFGKLAKNDKMMIQTYQHDQPETDPPFHFRFRDNIMVSSPDLLAYYAALGEDPSVKMLMIEELTERKNVVPTISSPVSPIINPLYTAIGTDLSNKTFPYSDRYPDGRKLSVTHEKGNAVIAAHGESADNGSLDLYITLSESHKYPVLLEKKKVYTQSDTPQTRECLQASDFVKLNGGCLLPRKVYLFKLIDNRAYGEENTGKWSVIKWESEDLGKERPRRKDFFIPLEPNTDFQSLRSDLIAKLKRKQPEYFKLDTYTPRDLMTHDSEYHPELNRQLIMIWTRPAVVLLGALIIIFSIYLKYRHSQKRKQAAE